MLQATGQAAGHLLQVSVHKALQPREVQRQPAPAAVAAQGGAHGRAQRSVQGTAPGGEGEDRMQAFVHLEWCWATSTSTAETLKDEPISAPASFQTARSMIYSI